MRPCTDCRASAAGRAPGPASHHVGALHELSHFLGIEARPVLLIPVAAIAAVAGIAATVVVIALERGKLAENGFHGVALRLANLILHLALLAAKILKLLLLVFINVEFLDHVFAEDDVRALELELNLSQSAHLALIEDLGERFAVLTKLVHGFAHLRELRGPFGIHLAWTIAVAVAAAAIAAVSSAAALTLTAPLTLTAGARILTAGAVLPPPPPKPPPPPP